MMFRSYGWTGMQRVVEVRRKLEWLRLRGSSLLVKLLREFKVKGQDKERGRSGGGGRGGITVRLRRGGGSRGGLLAVRGRGVGGL